MTQLRRARSEERGQVFIMVALWTVALFGMCGLALDVGLMFVARAELRRDVDAAALAAIVELPNTTNVTTRATEYLTANDPSATLDPISYPATGQIQLTAHKNKDLVFLPLVPGIKALLIGGTAVQVSGSATAGSGSSMDLGLSLDDTGSMDSGCNGTQTNAGCPIKEERDGANTLLNIVGIDGTGVVMGSLAPTRGCYNDTGASGCIDFTAPSSKVINLTGTKATLTSGIAAMVAAGGSGTNICTGVYEAGTRIRTGPGARATARKVLVVMSDFDNNLSATQPFPSPSTTCKPPSTGTSDSKIDNIDLMTYNAAQAHKLAGVEIFVIGYSLEGAASATLCNTGQITGLAGTGRTSTGDLLDRNLGKCVASSTAGTNDHFFEAPTALDLQAAFTQIGQIISTRLIK
ncbi:MAG: pilus assembly protein TadG-related protein [Dehalococcoidia bacterium]